MLGDGGAADRQADGDLAHRQGPGREALEHLQAGGIGQGGESGR